DGGIVPHGNAVLAPIKREAPARKTLARIPFALAMMQHAARREARLQAADEFVGEGAFRWSYGGGVPFLRFEVVDRDESRLAAHRQADVVADEIGIDLFAKRVELRPGGLRERQRAPGRLSNTGNSHIEMKIDIGWLDQPGNRRGGAIMRRRGDRQMPPP